MSSVSCTDLCPARYCTVFMFAPERIISVMYVWRSWCGVTGKSIDMTMLCFGILSPSFKCSVTVFPSTICVTSLTLRTRTASHIFLNDVADIAPPFLLQITNSLLELFLAKVSGSISWGGNGIFRYAALLLSNSLTIGAFFPSHFTARLTAIYDTPSDK